MNHGLNNTILYTANKFIGTFTCRASQKTKIIYGTAFFVINSKNEICLVTNRHNIDLNYKEPTTKYNTFELTKVIIQNKAIDHSTNLPTIINNLDLSNLDDIVYSSIKENDIAVLKPVKIKGSNNNIAFPIPYSWIASKEALCNAISVCDFVAFPGFPAWYDKLNNNPILRFGTIASDPRFDYWNEEKYNGECIAFEAFSYSGSSGSPIFALQKGFPVAGIISAEEGFFRRVLFIGINAGHLKVEDYSGQHSGISYFYKSSSISELID